MKYMLPKSIFEADSPPRNSIQRPASITEFIPPETAKGGLWRERPLLQRLGRRRSCASREPLDERRPAGTEVPGVDPVIKGIIDNELRL